MRYHYELKTCKKIFYGEYYECDHPVYNECTLFLIGEKGLAVVQQVFDKETKSTRWTAPSKELNNDLYSHKNFLDFFNQRAGLPDENGLYPTVTIRQLMWGIRMKPIKRERWETYFDRQLI